MTSIHFLILSVVSITQSSIFTDLRQNAFTPKDVYKNYESLKGSSHKAPYKFKKEDIIDIEAARNKAKVLNAARKKGKEVEKGIQLPYIIKGADEKQRYHLDSVLNLLKRKSWRRKFSDSSADESSSSSSLELKNWKDEWKEHWLQKKFEAINSSVPRGDTVNMAAAMVSITQSSIFTDLRQNAFTPKDVYKNYESLKGSSHKAPYKFKKEDIIDIEAARNKAKVLNAARKKGKEVEKGIQLPYIIKGADEKQRYHLDSVLNLLKRKSWRRKFSDSSADESSSSSSLELKNWKDEWKEHWLQKKFEAINSSVPRGDTVNMAAARPWGLPCGDPNQHDMPWGTCMLPMECEAEFRIFRGDYFCGRTQFVCCALQMTTYDMYQGFDVSFADSSLQTDSEEKKNRDKGSKEKRRRKKYRDQRKRRRERMKRKRKMKRNIRKIVREIRKILNRSYRNGTTEKKRKTKQLKKFVKLLKKKYKEERKTIMDLHEIQVIQTDAAVQEKLNQIKNMNREFMKNGTFRDIIINGTINEKTARMLFEAYPDLLKTLRTRRGGAKPPRDYLDYDIEYGYLYY